MNKKVKSLSLSRETLRELVRPELAEAEGGAYSATCTITRPCCQSIPTDCGC